MGALEPFENFERDLPHDAQGKEQESWKCQYYSHTYE